MERGTFSTRLGFILVSAGCAIGLGNVWRVPFITGKFLAILGLPIMVAEFAVGRASKRSASLSFDILEPKGTKWHLYKYGCILGNAMLMMFYTTITGWMFYYLYKMATGGFVGLAAKDIGSGQNMASYIVPMFVAALFYLIVIYFITFIIKRIEKHLKKSDLKTSEA